MNLLLVQLVVLGLVSGVFVGMFGIGGGAVMVPAMVLLLGLDQKLASGTSLAAQILPIGLFGAAVYYQNGNINIKYALLIGIGLVIGAFFGAKFTNMQSISSETIKNIFGVFLIVVGLRYLLIK
jgi:uncharacterized membrane protein YfcA